MATDIMNKARANLPIRNGTATATVNGAGYYTVPNDWYEESQDVSDDFIAKYSKVGKNRNYYQTYDQEP